MKPTSKIWTAIFLIMAALITIGAFMPSEFPAIAADAPKIDTGDTAWMIVATAMVLFMTPGLAFFYGGMVNVKNVISTMFQSFVCMSVVSLLWGLVVFSMAFGDSIGGFIGNPMTFFALKNVGLAPNAAFSATIPFVLFMLFQLKFAIITPALITGSFAERVKFNGYLLFICLFTLFIYAPLAHWTWHPDGFLRKWGVLDFAGGTVVHMSGGLAALVGAIVLGRRNNGGHNLPANIPYILLGTGILWFGWFGFNAGSALGANGLAVQAFATTNMASATAMVTWVFFDAVRGRKISAVGAAIGAVVGLVAITPAAGFVNISHAVFIGFIAAVISNIAVYYKNKFSLDDTLDVFPCHGIGGIVGMICTGIFAKDVGLFYGQTATFIAHMKALVIVATFVIVGTYIIYKLTNLLVPMRVSEEQEEAGLDLTQHGETHDIKERYKSLEVAH